jgi:hypothetical protein
MLRVIFSGIFSKCFEVSVAIFLKLKWLVIKNNECVCGVLILLGKTAAENVTILKEAFKDEDMGKTSVRVV